MTQSGGCYCGNLRYEIDGEAIFKAQCHCRECQYISGGGPNYFALMPGESFRWTRGASNSFTRSDIENPVTRDFCPKCGTHIVTRRRGQAVLKVGTLDNPAWYDGPSAAIHCADKQSFHVISGDIGTFDRLPPR